MPISSTLWSMWGVVLQKRGSFFLHSRRVSRGWGKGEEGGKRERYCESAVLQKRGVIFQQNGIGEKEKRDGRERESEMRKKESESEFNSDPHGLVRFGVQMVQISFDC